MQKISQIKFNKFYIKVGVKMENNIEQLIEKENLINKYLKECIDIID